MPCDHCVFGYLFSVVVGVIIISIILNFCPKVKYYTKFIIYYSWLTFSACITLSLTFFKPRNVANFKYPMFFLRLVARFLNFRTRVINRQNLDTDQPCVIICNHQSSVDLLAICHVWPKFCTVLAKKSLIYAGPFGPSAWLCGTVFIDRASHEKAIDIMNQVAKQVIDEKLKVFIFVEGTRRCGKKLQPFKKGAFHLAVEAQVPIIPIVVSSYLPFMDPAGKRFDSGECTIQCLPPVPTAGLDKSKINELMEKVYADMSAAFDPTVPDSLHSE